MSRENQKLPRAFRRVCLCMTALAAGWGLAAIDLAAAQAAYQVPETSTSASYDTDDDATYSLDDDKYMRPTKLGIRLTPKMANAMSGKFVEQMISRYDLDERQAEDIRGIISRQIMRFAHENEKTNQELIEYMMATMIEYDGRFTPDAAQQFAVMAKPIVPAMKDLFTRSGAEIGKKLTVSQRLKFTGDMAGAAAGLTIFESRMKRWEEGKVGENANPFWDPADKDPAKAEAPPPNPDEHPQHRRARMEVERWSEWEIRIDDQWADYLDRAAEFYKFDEAQRTSAEAVLKQCRERAAAIKTNEWESEIKRNRIARRLARISGADFREGPVIFNLDQEYNKLRQPLVQLDEEFKRRIDELPDSSQRAAAQQSVRKMLADRGMKQPPI